TAAGQTGAGGGPTGMKAAAVRAERGHRVPLCDAGSQLGCRVRLCVAGTVAGETIPFYVRDDSAGKLHGLGVEVIPYARLFGGDPNLTSASRRTTAASPPMTLCQRSHYRPGRRGPPGAGMEGEAGGLRRPPPRGVHSWPRRAALKAT
ncbi:MAG: hypothetical protein KAT39_12915, partial [Alphaproteobacteria bacterium]|nr:hypothetical protein [Alphaproteobacteria bacterium]